MYNYTKLYRLIISVTIVVAALCSFTIASEISFEGESDWPMYQYNAQHTGYNDKDSITVPLQLLWKKRYQPDLYPINQPVVIGNKVVISNKDKQTTYPLLVLRCLESNTGIEIWKQEFDSTYDLSPPAYYDGKIICEINKHWGMVYAFDFLTGNTVWQRFYNSQWAKSLGPVIYKDKVYFVAGFYGGLECINASTGDSLWWTGFNKVWDECEPAIFEDNSYVFLSGWLRCFDNNTGTMLWENRILPQDVPDAVGTVPVIDTISNIVYVSQDEGLYAVDLETTNTLWRYDWSYVAIWDTLGLWSFQRLTPAICNGRVYASHADSVNCYDGLTGELIWNYKTDTSFWSPPVIANNLMFICSLDSTFAFNLQTHEKVWSYPISGQLSVGNNRLYVGTRAGDFYAFGRIATDVDDNFTNELPSGFELHQNYPNPFNPSTNITFTIPTSSYVYLTIYNILGQEIVTLVDDELSAGEHTYQWDAKNFNNNDVSTGMYLYKLTMEKFTDVKKMVYIK